jgi:hypothetical protein
LRPFEPATAYIIKQAFRDIHRAISLNEETVRNGSCIIHASLLLPHCCHRLPVEAPEADCFSSIWLTYGESETVTDGTRTRDLL